MARETRQDIGLLILRVGYAVLLIGFHGWARFFRAYHYAIGHQPWTFVAVVERLGFPFAGVFAVLSALSESVGAFFLGLGLFTRLAALAIAFNMSVAFYNEAIKWTNGGTPELPALYLLGAVSLLILGGGPYTIRRLIGGRR